MAIPPIIDVLVVCLLFCLLVYSDAASISADVGLHPSWCALRGQAACGNPGYLEKRETCKAPYLPSSSYSWYSSVKRVQVVVAMVGFFPSSGGRRSPECAVRRCGRENLGTQSPPTSEPPDGSAAGRRAHTYTLTHTPADAFTSAHGWDDGDFPCWSGRGGWTL